MLERRSYFAFLLLGIIGPVHGLALPHLITRHSLALSAAGLLFFAGSMGYITASSTYAFCQRRWNEKTLLTFGALVTTIGLALIPSMPNWTLTLSASYLAGYGSGLIEVGFNALVAGLEPERAKPTMNWLHFAFSIGSLSGPILMSALSVWTGHWPVLYWTGSFLFIFFVLLWLHTPLAAIFPKKEQSNGLRASNRQLLCEWPFWALNITMFIYVGAEVALAGWITTYLSGERGVPVQWAALGLSLLWGGLTLGRGLGGKMAGRFENRSLLLTLFSGSAVFTAALAYFGSIPVLFASLFAIGFFFSAIFPTIMLHGSALYPKLNRTMSGSLVTAAGVGALLVPTLLGLIADSATLAAGIGLVAFVLLVAAVISLSIPQEKTAR